MDLEPSLRRSAVRLLAAGMAVLLGAGPVAATDPSRPETPIVFSQAQFDQLGFLLGDWRGTAPDGSVFYERYQRGGPTELQSLRYATDAFAQASDGSTLSLADGRIEARWGEFTWQASRVDAAEACFEPVNAPSAFCWTAEGADRLTVTQRWTDAEGVAQSVQIAMTRVATTR
jgi:hypothetical protein